MNVNGNLAYQEELWEELIGGVPVAMSPRPTVNHSRAAGNIYRIFSRYLEKRKCEAFPDGVDLYLTDEDRFVPDGMVVCDPDRIEDNGVYGAPDLVVEVLSPSTARYDRGRKMKVYGACGVKEYWIVDPGNKMVEQYFQENGQMVLNDVYAIHPDYMLKKMTQEEQDAIPKQFKCSLFDDLDIVLEDVFSRVT